MTELLGIHHLTAVTADARRNLRFYCETLGMRLVKKTVNQDDVSAYHLFYGDGVASPGSDITFFEFDLPAEKRGTSSVIRTMLRVAGQNSLNWWKRHFEATRVQHSELVERDGRLTLDFEDHEGQRLSLVDDGGDRQAFPWSKSPIPAAHQIRGLGPIVISVPDLTATDQAVSALLGMQQVREYDLEGSTIRVYQMGPGGAAAELHIAVQPELPRARLGAGGVHHVAFRSADSDYNFWADRLNSNGVNNSGKIDRFYFKSLYFREPGGVLFELATDGPGFDVDEPLESLGEKLALPPFLEHRREEIESGLAKID